MTATATNQGPMNNTNGTNGTTSGRTRAAMTPVDAISKISKILDQLSLNDRKRVLAFVNDESSGE
jgi:hypothetical protein